MCLPGLVNHFILAPSNIPLPGYSTACLSIHLPEDTSVTAKVFKLAGHGSVLSSVPWLHEDQTVPHLLFWSPQPKAEIIVEREPYGNKKMKILILCKDIFEKLSSVLDLSIQLLRTIFPLSLVDEIFSLSLTFVQKARISISLKWKTIDYIYIILHGW